MGHVRPRTLLLSVVVCGLTLLLTPSSSKAFVAGGPNHVERRTNGLLYPVSLFNQAVHLSAHRQLKELRHCCRTHPPPPEQRLTSELCVRRMVEARRGIATQGYYAGQERTNACAVRIYHHPLLISSL